MRVLVACEYSGRVRDAFRRHGHEAWSVDLLPTESDPSYHIIGDALEAIDELQPHLLIAHPPCTYLANSGVRWLYGGKGTVRDPRRWRQMEDGARFFADLLASQVPHVAVENPIMHGYARMLVEDRVTAAVVFERQTIQPYEYGHGETKATQLWLRNLPPLTPTNIVNGREARVHRMAPSPDRWKERSRTYPGIAEAMAEQWGAIK